jgi:hypothetical protein
MTIEGNVFQQPTHFGILGLSENTNYQSSYGTLLYLFLQVTPTTATSFVVEVSPVAGGPFSTIFGKTGGAGVSVYIPFVVPSGWWYRITATGGDVAIPGQTTIMY